jgi:hypothetical protein
MAAHTAVTRRCRALTNFVPSLLSGRELFVGVGSGGDVGVGAGNGGGSGSGSGGKDRTIATSTSENATLDAQIDARIDGSALD